MTSILQSLSKTVHISLALSILLFLGLYFGNGGFDIDVVFWSWLFRYIHVIVAIMWIGLLWYFNFVQIPNMAKIPDEQKPAIGKIAFFMDDISGEVNKKIKKTQPKRISLASFNFLVIQSDPPKSG